MATPEDDEQEAAAHAVREVLERFHAGRANVLAERDAGLRAVVERYGLRQKRVVELTGYSRETVRQALKPGERAAVAARERARRAGGEDGSRDAL
jgi:hypothetical protein